MNNRLIAFGDIHGCRPALESVLARIEPQASDTLIFLGDVIDRGPDSRGVIDQLISLKNRCQMVPLLGNHEEMMLRARASQGEVRNFWLRWGGAQTLASYGGTFDGVPNEHWDFLHSCHLCWQTDRFAFAHANYLPNEPWDDQPTEQLLWESLKRYRPGPHVSGKKVIVGHTPQNSGEILDLGHLVCIDTYCYGGRWLTAYECNTGQTWQADRDGNVRNGS